MKKLFFISCITVFSITTLGCIGNKEKSKTKPTLPPQTPSGGKKPLKPITLDDAIINKAQGLVAGKVEQFLTKLKNNDATAISEINNPLPIGYGPILLAVIASGAFADEDDLVAVIQFLGKIKNIDVNKKSTQSTSPLVAAIGNPDNGYTAKVINALLDIGADKNKKLVYNDQRGTLIANSTAIDYAQYQRGQTNDNTIKAR